jgi:hypothetical protein
MLRNYARALTSILRAQNEKGALTEDQVAALRWAGSPSAMPPPWLRLEVVPVLVLGRATQGCSCCCCTRASCPHLWQVGAIALLHPRMH